MTTITIQVEDSSNIQKILEFVHRLKGYVKVLPDNDIPLSNDDLLDEDDNELLSALIHLETLPNNEPYSVARSKQLLEELKAMD
jgi:hypothetical protein